MKRKRGLVLGWLVGWWISGLAPFSSADQPTQQPAHPATKPEAVLQARSRAVEYLRARQNEDGGFPLVAGASDAEVTAWATLALSLAERPEKSEAAQRGRAYLLQAQAQDGSWNRNTAHTAFAAWTLLAMENEEAVSPALKWLTATQQEDGSWGREPEAPSLTIYTGVALTLLGRAGRKGHFPGYSIDAALQRGREWLWARQNEDGGWPMADGPSRTMATSWALLGLLAAGVEPSNEAVLRGSSWLQQRQTTAGGFTASAASDPPDPELTAYALLTFIAARAESEAVQRAVSYLEKVQQPDGGFISGTPRELEEPTENLQTTSFVAIALSLVQEPRSAP